jgi:acetyl esterase/lipase
MWTMSQAQSPKTNFRAEPDVIFASVGEETLRLDLCLPVEGEGPFPAVICIHGGGWVSGSRKQMTQTIEVFARRGYVAVAPDYRLAPKHRWPACIEDVKTAVRWLRGNAGRYRIANDRIGVLGLSAGGHLACLLGVTDRSDGLEGTAGHADQSSAVQAVVSFSGPTDLTAEELWTKEVRTSNLEPLFGGSPETRRDAIRKASPVHYSPRTPPPILLVHGLVDKTVPVAQAHALGKKLRDQGGVVRIMELEGEGHTFAGPRLTRAIDQMLTFFDERLKKER